MKKRILVVDDDFTTVRLVKLILEKTGAYEVREETRGSHGLAAARQFRPDLVLLDINMPDTDGGEVARQLQADRTLRNTPILFLTAIVSPREAGHSPLTRGGHQFIAKPVHGPELIESIETMLAQ